MHKDTSVTSAPVQDSFLVTEALVRNAQAPDLRRLSMESSQERPWDARRKASRSTSCCALQLPALSPCHSALLVCIYRLNHPYPACTMFPKHSLITVNQRAGSAAARPCEHLVNDGKRLQRASSAPDGMARRGSCPDCGSKGIATSRLARKGDPLCLTTRNEQALSAENDGRRPSTCPHLLLQQMIVEPKQARREAQG